MGKVYVKQSGVWKQVQALWVKSGGVWKSPTSALITQSGVGKQFYPDAVGPTTYAAHGTYSYVVPAGVTSVVATIVGAGGGSGATNSNGNILASGGGGSGGYLQNQTVAVTPGETLTVVVGAGGYGGNYRFNSNYQYFNTAYPTWPNQNPGTYNGGDGDTSYIKRNGTNLLTAGGGGGGVSMGAGGAAGSPNGVAGTGGAYNTGVCNTLMRGGVNALALGSGANNPQCQYGLHGDDGYVSITPVNANSITFSSGSGTWTVPAGVTSIRLTMIGAGGNGNANEGRSNPGPGGGSGAYFSNVTVAVTPGASIAYSVGGAGGILIPSGDYYNGQPIYIVCGGNTTFGSLTAGGGIGGHWRAGNSPWNNEVGGEGGTATGTGGVNGTSGNNGSLYGGNGYGANSPYGTGGVGVAGQAGSNGGNASGFGAGGGGGGNNSGGGAGSSGFILINY
jgi:hypothetical protein